MFTLWRVWDPTADLKELHFSLKTYLCIKKKKSGVSLISIPRTLNQNYMTLPSKKKKVHPESITCSVFFHHRPVWKLIILFERLAILKVNLEKSQSE